MVQAWYQGGLSVFDFTDSAHPVEIAFFDRGPIDGKNLLTGGYWSTYWYNGHIYGTEIARGLDIFTLKPSEFLTQNEIDAAVAVRSTEFNAQRQPKVTWPATPAVARAYLDQLARSKALKPEQASSIAAALNKDKTDKSTLDEQATQLESDAASASGRDADRLRALATTLKELRMKELRMNELRK
jgi:hypothetical protein